MAPEVCSPTDLELDEKKKNLILNKRAILAQKAQAKLDIEERNLFHAVRLLEEEVQKF